jgi:CRISPR-associated protein Cmr3
VKSPPSFATIGLSLDPLDTLFFRDGRPFEPASRIASGLPVPQTLAGALRTWLLREAGCDFEQLRKAMIAGASFVAAAAGQLPELDAISRLMFRGPWFARNGKPLVPVPATLRWIDEDRAIIRRLDPLRDRLPGWEDAGTELLPLWCRDPRPAEPVRGYLTMSGLASFLAGKMPAETDIISSETLFVHDRRTGIAIEPETLATTEGMIYGVSLLALAKDVSLYAEVLGDAKALARVPEVQAAIPLGGESRRVIVRKRPPVTWPVVGPTDRQGRGTLVLLTSPAPFDDRWKPGFLAPVAAAVAGCVSVSGWDLARGGPKPNRFAVEAGSVYFLSQPLNPPTPGSLCATDDAALGWGTFLEGVWSHV